MSLTSLITDYIRYSQHFVCMPAAVVVYLVITIASNNLLWRTLCSSGRAVVLWTGLITPMMFAVFKRCLTITVYFKLISFFLLIFPGFITIYTVTQVNIINLKRIDENVSIHYDDNDAELWRHQWIVLHQFAISIPAKKSTKYHHFWVVSIVN